MNLSITHNFGERWCGIKLLVSERQPSRILATIYPHGDLPLFAKAQLAQILALPALDSLFHKAYL